MLHTLEAQAEGDKNRLMAIIEGLQKQQGYWEKEVAALQAKIKELEDLIHRLSHEKFGETPEQRNEYTFLKKELDRKTEIAEELKKQVAELQEKLDEVQLDEDSRLKLLETRLKEQERKIVEIVEGRYSGEDEFGRKILAIIDDIKSFNHDILERHRQLEHNHKESVDKLKNLQNHIVKDQMEISKLLERIKELEKIIEGKDDTIHKMQRHIDLRLKTDKGHFKDYVNIRKENSALKDQIYQREGAIARLQASNEKQVQKNIDNSKLVDRLRHENDKFRGNYKITNSYSPRRHDDLPATIEDDYRETSQPRSRQSPYSPNRSPERSQNAHELSFQHPEESYQPKYTENSHTHEGVPSRAARPAHESMPIKLGVFFKAISDLIVSDRIDINRRDRSFVFRSVNTKEDGTRDRLHKVDQIFTQFDLKYLNEVVSDQMSSQNNLLYLIYGQPLNIKLFLVHKIVHLAINRYVNMLAAGIKAVVLCFHANRDFSEYLLQLYEQEQENFGGEPASAVFQRVRENGGGNGSNEVLMLRSRNLQTVEKLKKCCFTLFSQPHSSHNDFLKLSVVEEDKGQVQEFNIFCTEAHELSENVYTHLKDFLFAIAQVSNSPAETEAQVANINWKGLFSQFFFVYEPKKDMIEDDIHLMTLFHHFQKTAALVKLNESLYSA